MARAPPNRVASQWEKIMEDSNEWTGIQHRNEESVRKAEAARGRAGDAGRGLLGAKMS